MQKVLCRSQAVEYADALDPKIADYIDQRQIAAFEGFENFSLMAFDWYDVCVPGAPTVQILIYLDREDLFFFCPQEDSRRRVLALVPQGQTNEQALYLFFRGLLKPDLARLEAYESEITDAEDEALGASRRDYLAKIVGYRKELLRLKRYYDQLDAILDNLSANDNGLLSREGVRHFMILGNRTERFRSSVLNLRDYVTQMREAYQAQIDIEQNSLMKVFTLITAVFLPLTLLVGWYGMNFKYMPELNQPMAYPVFILCSVLICAGLVLYFRKRRWL